MAKDIEEASHQVQAVERVLQHRGEHLLCEWVVHFLREAVRSGSIKEAFRLLRRMRKRLLQLAQVQNQNERRCVVIQFCVVCACDSYGCKEAIQVTVTVDGREPKFQVREAAFLAGWHVSPDMKLHFCKAHQSSNPKGGAS